MIALLFSRTGITVLLAGAALCFVAWGYQLHRLGLIQTGYDRAMAEVQEASRIQEREAQREYTRLIERIKEVQDDYLTEQARVAQYRDRWRSADERMREQERDFAARIAAASSESLRQYAAQADADFGRCIGHVERFAAEAASCSAAAHALIDADQPAAPQQDKTATP